jgi:L-2-hydroxyglutarate oxidase LhgO
MNIFFVSPSGGMPVSGKFLVCQDPKIIELNRNKVFKYPPPHPNLFAT